MINLNEHSVPLVDEMLSDIQWFMGQFERMYGAHITTPHVQIKVTLLELIRALMTSSSKYSFNPINFDKDGYLYARFGNFNLTLVAKVD